MGYHEYISRLYTDTNQLPPSANFLHGETWKKSKGNWNFIWKVFLNVDCRVSPSTLSECSSRILRLAYILTCIGTYTHIFTHSLGSGANSSKAIFDSLLSLSQLTARGDSKNLWSHKVPSLTSICWKSLTFLYYLWITVLLYMFVYLVRDCSKPHGGSMKWKKVIVKIRDQGTK